MESILRHVALATVESIWPRFCLRCGREGELLCTSCQENYRPRIMFAACPFCGRIGSNTTCQACRPQTYLDELVSLSAYGDPVVRQAIELWKYHGDRQAQEVIGRWVRQLVAGGQMTQIETVSYVPLHETKKRSRGFDQAEELAKLAAGIFNRPMKQVLRRKKRTKSQAQMAHEQRLVGDMDGIYQALGEQPESVLLCDDVFTSGATMDAAAKELKENGVKWVSGLTIAKGSTKT